MMCGDNSQEWKKQYVKGILSTGPNEESCNLMLINKPKSLFRYRSGIKNDGKNRDLENLENDVMCLCAPLLLNDPFDSYINMDYSDYLQEAINNQNMTMNRAKRRKFSKHCNKIKKDIDKETEGTIEDIRNRIFIGCFSETEKSLLMWSHYANYHKGFCIEYDFEQLENEYLFLSPVIYENEPTNLYNNDTRVVYEQLLTKARDWKYENEWRVISTYKDDRLEFISDSIRKIKTPKPAKIYLGCKSGDLEEEITRICKMKDIKLDKMKMHKNKFELFSESII